MLHDTHPSLKYAKKQIDMTNDLYIHWNRVRVDTIDKLMLKRILEDLNNNGGISLNALLNRLREDCNIRLTIRK